MLHGHISLSGNCHKLVRFKWMLWCSGNVNVVLSYMTNCVTFQGAGEPRRTEMGSTSRCPSTTWPLWRAWSPWAGPTPWSGSLSTKSATSTTTTPSGTGMRNHQALSRLVRIVCSDLCHSRLIVRINNDKQVRFCIVHFFYIFQLRFFAFFTKKENTLDLGKSYIFLSIKILLVRGIQFKNENIANSFYNHEIRAGFRE